MQDSWNGRWQSFIVSTINILVKNWIKLAGLLKKTIGERGKFKKKLECYKAKCNLLEYLTQ